MIPGVYNFTVPRGSTQPFIFRLTADGLPLIFDDVRLSINRGVNGVVVYSFLAGEIVNSDPAIGEFTWTPTPEQTRLFPIGPRSRYEVEVWEGENQDPYMTGIITGIGGINDD